MLDPGLKEEAARGGALTVVANAHKELCAVHKADGIGLSLAQARALISVCRADELVNGLHQHLWAGRVALAWDGIAARLALHDTVFAAVAAMDQLCHEFRHICQQRCCRPWH